MKSAPLFLAALLALAGLLPLSAQTPDDSSTNATTTPDATTRGPVILPPAAPPVSGASMPAFAPPPIQASPNAPEEKLDDIRPPIFSPDPWIWIVITLAILGAIVLLGWLWQRFAPRRRINAQSAYDLALEELERARLLMREEEPAPYAVAVSETVRSYLGRRFHSPSPRRTTQEFLRQMQADPATPLAEYRDLLGDFLQACDLVKFARYQPTLDELEQVQQRAVSFVTATKPEPAVATAARNGHTP